MWTIESARGLGYLLAQQLVAAGETVIDVPAALSTRTRLLGSGRAQKNDPNDARSVAITAMRVEGLQRVSADEHAQVLKLLAKRHRDLGQLKSKAACRLHALLMELLPGGMAKEMTVTRANDLLDQVVDQDQIIQHRVEVAREFVADVARYEAQVKASMKRLRAAVAASGTSLTDIRGVGVVTAALITGHTGDVSRFASAGHFASYNATAPIEALSGEHRRHRLAALACSVRADPVGVGPPFAGSTTFPRNGHRVTVTERNDSCTRRGITCEGLPALREINDEGSTAHNSARARRSVAVPAQALVARYGMRARSRSCRSKWVESSCARFYARHEGPLHFDRLFIYATPTGLFTEEISSTGRLLANLS